jgi:hypothetical protein
MLDRYELTDGEESFASKLMTEGMAEIENELADLLSGGNLYWKKIKE